jgi:hypothetical protein
MNIFLVLGQLLTLTNGLTPIIAGLLGDLKSQNPGMTDDEIIAKAIVLAAETKTITEADKGDQP